MTLSIMKKTAAVAAAAVLALGLTACGSSDDSEEARDDGQSSEETTSAAADDETTSEDSEDSGDSSGGGTDGAGSALGGQDPFEDLGDVEVGGSFSGSVDGQPIEIDSPGVRCTASEDSGLLIGAASTERASEEGNYPAVAVLLDDSDNASMVSIARSEEDALTYMNNVTAGSAEVTKDGSSYTITGEAIRASDMDPSSTTPFELALTCP